MCLWNCLNLIRMGLIETHLAIISAWVTNTLINADLVQIPAGTRTKAFPKWESIWTLSFEWKTHELAIVFREIDLGIEDKRAPEFEMARGGEAVRQSLRLCRVFLFSWS